MTGFLGDIPVAEFSGARVEYITVGSSSLKFELTSSMSITFYYYGMIEDRDDWLYNLPLCGPDSVQRLVGQTLTKITFKDESHAEIEFSEGRVLSITHDDISQDLMNFKIRDQEYIA